MFCRGGDHEPSSRYDPVCLRRTIDSRRVAAGQHLAFTAVSAGNFHTCGVTAKGTAYCWGYGQLGDGTTTGRSSPVLVAGGVRFAGVSAGDSNACGVTAVGAAYCWGNNNAGQLGDGTMIPRLKPVLVAGGVSFKAVSAGFGHTCGVTAKGTAYCWGYNGEGELGDGTTTDRWTPVLVAGGSGFKVLSAGGLHTCGVTDGTAYCWGFNGGGCVIVLCAYGQLGDGTTTDRWVPTSVAGRPPFIAVSAGTYHTCGVTAVGAVYCWGYNDAGRLGTEP